MRTVRGLCPVHRWWANKHHEPNKLNAFVCLWSSIKGLQTPPLLCVFICDINDVCIAQTHSSLYFCWCEDFHNPNYYIFMSNITHRLGVSSFCRVQSLVLTMHRGHTHTHTHRGRYFPSLLFTQASHAVMVTNSVLERVPV